MCGRAAPSEAAHVGDDRGARLKCSDYETVPMCWQCHREGAAAHHKLTADHGRAFWQHHGIDREALIQRLRRCYAAATGRAVESSSLSQVGLLNLMDDLGV